MQRPLLPLLLVGLLASACGGRPESWDTKAELPLTSVNLTGSVAIADPALDRVLMLTATSDLGLSSRAIGVGENIVKVEPSRDRETLFVLSSGVQPRRDPDDERPSLSVLDGSTDPSRLARYTLTDPLGGIAVDPLGEWVVVYDSTGIVENPNELIFVNVKDPSFEPVSKTLRSFGAKPERITFTTELTVPNGDPRRFLIVETSQDIALVDLSDLNRDEVTILMPKTPAGKTGSPQEVAFHDGDPTDATDARIAVRLYNDPNVMLVDLASPENGDDKPFKAKINVADVGGVPTSIAFVQTDGGLQLAALVPSKLSATLVDPATTTTESVDLEKPYTRITRITDDVSDKPASADVALLWSESTTGIAFWSLGKTSGTPFRSVDPYEIGIAVSAVKHVPGTKFAHLKILESTTASEFYVLDLDQRESFPMVTNASGFTLSLSPDGERAWALKPGTPDMGSIDLSNLHPTSIELERNVVAIHDIARRDAGRAAIAIHVKESSDDVSVGATVLDALEPDTANSRFYGGLMLGGLE